MAGSVEKFLKELHHPAVGGVRKGGVVYDGVESHTHFGIY